MKVNLVPLTPPPLVHIEMTQDEAGYLLKIIRNVNGNYQKGPRLMTADLGRLLQDLGVKPKGVVTGDLSIEE